jgi:hypothetical protein
MTQFIPKAVLCFASLALLCSLAKGQDIPAVTPTPTYQGFQLPTELGSLNYALTFSERVRTGYYSSKGDIWTTNISGDAGYLSRSENRPFSMTYAGGYLYNSGDVPSSVFQDLTLSQSLNTRLWNTSISDAVSYLPETPSSGLSGIPGVGDVGVTAPPTGGDPGQGILSRNSQRVSNSTNVNIQRQLTGSTSLQGGGGYFIERFLGNVDEGLDTQSISAQGNANHRIDALNKIEGGYSYTHLSYEGQPSTFSTQKVTIGYTRQMSPRLSVHATVGPQFVTSAGSPLASSSANISVDSGFAYTTQHFDYNVDYSRGVRTGSGVVQGTFADSVVAQGSRRLGEYMHFSLSGGYTHSASVANLTTIPFDIQTLVGNAEIARTISQSLNVFLNYSVQHQSSSATLTTANAFTGTSQTFGFGITYSPRQLHLGH